MTCFYEVPKQDTSCNTPSDYKPLPSTITDFIAECMCGILDTHQPPGFKWDNVPLPELVFFIKKVTTKAKVDVPTAIASLILASRFKKRLPKNAHGEYGTYHKIFLASLLIASKEFMPKTEEETEVNTCNDNADSIQSDSDSNPNDTKSDDENDTSSDNDTNSSLSESPNSNILSTTPLSMLSNLSISDDDDQDNGILFKQVPAPNNVDHKQTNVVRPVINKKLCDISGIYNRHEIDLMEREFMWRLGGNNKVTDKDIREYVESNRHALGIH